jgi:hypothetical protein
MKYILLVTLCALGGYVLASYDAPPRTYEAVKPTEAPQKVDPAPAKTNDEDLAFPGSPFPYPGAAGV